MYRKPVPFVLAIVAALALVTVVGLAPGANAQEPELGSSGDLTAGIPEPADAVYQSQNAIQEGGRHFFYTSSASPSAVVGNYQAALSAAGWEILSSGGGGDPFGMFGGGAGLTATDGTRHLSFNAGGPAGQTFIDACVWPAQPSDDDCDQNQRQQTSGAAVMGAGGDLLASVPEPADATFKAEDAIQEGGRHFFYTSSAAPSDVVSNYQAALTAAGWNIVSSGGGGDPFGMFGGGAGLTATNGGRYLKFNAGGPPGQTFIDACVWPAQPSDDNCGQNQNTNGNAVMGSAGDLTAGVPEPANATYQSQDAIHEGGRHFFYTSSEGPSDVVSAYQSALESAGWNIIDSGGGGDPFGLFGGGAGLTASDGSRYLKFNAGGPPGSTFINACLWPTQPSNTNCQNQQKTTGTAVMGSGGNLTAGVPDLANAEFKAEDAIQEGGQHFFYTSSASPSDVVGNYESALSAAGWNIISSGGGGDPFGMFGGGAGLTASDGARYLKLNAGGPPGQTFIDGCIWPAQPANDNCGQNQDQQGTMGVGGDLVAGVPELANAEFKAEDAIQEGGRHFFFTSSASPSDVVGSYQSALEAAGWTIESSGGGGDPFGLFGGGAGLTANDGTRYLKLNAGGPPGQTFIDGCIWPAQPSDDNCGQNQNQQQGVMGAGGDLLAGVPEPANAVFKAEDAIQEGGRHFFYTSGAPPSDVVSAYQAALEAAGWNIISSGGGGDPFGFGGGAGLTASDSTRYLKFNAGGPAGQTFIDACVWPSQPSDDNCGQNDNDND